MKNITLILCVLAALLASCTPPPPSTQHNDTELRKAFYQAIWIDCLIFGSDPTRPISPGELVKQNELIVNCTETLRIAVEDRMFEDKLRDFPPIPDIPLTP